VLLPGSKGIIIVTRRGFLAIPAVSAAPRSTPHNSVAIKANEFHAKWSDWADEFNRTPQGGFSASAALMVPDLSSLFRRFEHSIHEYLKAQR
jgi:hypothetical protein